MLLCNVRTNLNPQTESHDDKQTGAEGVHTSGKRCFCSSAGFSLNRLLVSEGSELLPSLFIGLSKVRNARSDSPCTDREILLGLFAFCSVLGYRGS